MRELVVDVTRLVDRGLQGRLPTGVDRVSLEYLRYFGNQAKALVRFAGRWVFLEGADSRRVICELLAPSPQFGRLVRWCVAKAYVSGSQVRAQCVLLNTGHSGLDQPDYARQIRSRGMLPIFFLHDLIPITHPEYSRAGEAAKHHQRVSTMLTQGRGLIVNSIDTRTAIQRYAVQHNCPMPPCAVAPLAPAALPHTASERPLAQPYFVMLGTIEPRKNHGLLLHIWRQLVEELGSAAPRLVIIGQRGWECEQVLDLLERCDALRTHVVEKNACSDAELANWLVHSQALLFPSFVEGFGMPLVEALSLGAPVVASDLTVFREIAADIPEYLHPLDGVGWRRAIVEYAQPQSQARQAQCLRLRGYCAPTWSEHFAVVEAFLDQVVPVATVQ